VHERCYCPELGPNAIVMLSGREAHHLVKVRRVAVGTTVEVFDGKGAAYRAKVRAIERGRVELEVASEPLLDREAPVHLTLATAASKGQRLDWLVEKATELGVARLIPILTDRAVTDPRATKLDRLRGLIIEASKQCGRNRLMTLESPTEWQEYIREERAPVRLIAHPERGSKSAAYWPRLKAGGQVALAIGPEGGFTDPEVEAALAMGWQTVCLGPTLLRVETAALAGAAAILLLGVEEAGT
jgi:16S rRNA (uracil1498-N3)-methyltransferase